MEKQLFRKESMKHITSPEALHDYMRVTSPSLWMVLSAIVVLLTGFIVFASTASMENTVPIRVEVDTYDSQREEGGPEVPVTVVYGTLSSAWKDMVQTGMKLRLGSYTGSVILINISGADDGMEEEVILLFEMDNGNIPLPDGKYDAELVLESTTPISFLWN